MKKSGIMLLEVKRRDSLKNIKNNDKDKKGIKR